MGYNSFNHPYLYHIDCPFRTFSGKFIMVHPYGNPCMVCRCWPEMHTQRYRLRKIQPVYLSLTAFLAFELSMFLIWGMVYSVLDALWGISVSVVGITFIQGVTNESCM